MEPLIVDLSPRDISYISPKTSDSDPNVWSTSYRQIGGPLAHPKGNRTGCDNLTRVMKASVARSDG